MGTKIKSYIHSISKTDIYRTCPRKYAYQYKLSYGGWDEKASEETKRIHLLKNQKYENLWLSNNLIFCANNFLSNLNYQIDFDLDKYIKEFLNICKKNKDNLLFYEDSTETHDTLIDKGIQAIERFFDLRLEESIYVVQHKTLDSYKDSEGNEYYCDLPVLAKNEPDSNLFGIQPKEVYFLKFLFHDIGSQEKLEEEKLRQKHFSLNTSLYSNKVEDKTKRRSPFLKTVCFNLLDGKYFVVASKLEEISNFAKVIKDEYANMKKADSLSFSKQTPCFNPLFCKECQYKRICDEQEAKEFGSM